MIPLAIVSADKEIIELAREFNQYRLVGVFDNRPEADAMGLPVLGSDEAWAQVGKRFPGMKIALSLDHPEVKKKAALVYGQESLVSLVSKNAHVSSSARLGAGCILQRGVSIMASAQIGVGCKINVNATVHHDSTVGDFCTLAPGCQLLGSVTLEDQVFVGAGAIVLPKRRVGARATIGAGAVVTHDVPSGSTVSGVPARKMDRVELQ